MSYGYGYGSNGGIESYPNETGLDYVDGSTYLGVATALRPQNWRPYGQDLSPIQAPGSGFGGDAVDLQDAIGPGPRFVRMPNAWSVVMPTVRATESTPLAIKGRRPWKPTTMVRRFASTFGRGGNIAYTERQAAGIWSHPERRFYGRQVEDGVSYLVRPAWWCGIDQTTADVSKAELYSEPFLTGERETLIKPSLGWHLEFGVPWADLFWSYIALNTTPADPGPPPVGLPGNRSPAWWLYYGPDWSSATEWQDPYTVAFDEVRPVTPRSVRQWIAYRGEAGGFDHPRDEPANRFDLGCVIDFTDPTLIGFDDGPLSDLIELAPPRLTVRAGR